MTDEVMQAPVALDELDTGTEVRGKVSYLGVYGAMVDIGLQRSALLHISQLGRSDFRNIEDVFSVGDEVEAYVLKVDDEDRIALTMIKPPDLPWGNIRKGELYNGTVTRIESFGAFIDIGAERPGMVHVSEMADGYVQSPSDVVSVGDEVEVRVIKLNRRKRQIDLSMKSSVEEIEEILEPSESIPTAMEIALRRAQKQAEEDRKDENRKEDRKRYSEQQDDIISRTLRNHNP